MNEVYVIRDAAGRICDMRHEGRHKDQECLPRDHPEVLQFLHDRWRQNELERLDLEFVRVIEDLIEILMARQVILFTDLPPKVQEKLSRRRQVREQTEYTDTDQLIRL